MVSEETKAVAKKAKEIYEDRLRVRLEQSELGRYVSIEPESGDYFLGDTFDDAANAAIERYPERLTHIIRVGHAAAFHLGVLVR